MNDEVAASRRAQEEYREYVETWVHEVKTPIASALLLAENHPGEVSRAMIGELRQIDALVEQSMFYARSRQVEKDFLLRRVTLGELVSSALRRNAGLLIESRAAVERETLDLPVAADQKWIDFILTQLLTNSVKYAQGKLRLRFTGREGTGGRCSHGERQRAGDPAGRFAARLRKGLYRTERALRFACERDGAVPVPRSV